MLHAHRLQKCLERLPVRHLVAVSGKAPGGHHRCDGDVKGAAGGLGKVPGRLDQGADLRAHRHHLTAGAVEHADLAAAAGAGQQGVQPPHFLLRVVHGPGGFLAIGGEHHGRVHGNDLNALLGLVRVPRSAAARQAAHRQRRQQQCRDSFHSHMIRSPSDAFL